MDTLAEEDKERENEGDNRQLTAKHLDGEQHTHKHTNTRGKLTLGQTSISLGGPGGCARGS